MNLQRLVRGTVSNARTLACESFIPLDTAADMEMSGNPGITASRLNSPSEISVRFRRYVMGHTDTK